MGDVVSQLGVVFGVSAFEVCGNGEVHGGRDAGQDLLGQGAIDPAEAEQHPQANVITRAIGADGAEPELDKKIGKVIPGDTFLLCSDGLCKALAQTELVQLLRENANAERVLSAALAREATDNVTVLTVLFSRPCA